MMKARIRELIHTVPFQPFIIRMADGRECRVDHPDFVFASPKNRSQVIIEEPTEDRMHHLSALLITSVGSVSDSHLAA